MTFKAGDRVRLIKQNTSMAAKIGATALVLEYPSKGNYSDGYVKIQWERKNDLCDIQSDGKYNPEQFELIENARILPNPDFELDEIEKASHLIRHLNNG